LRAVPETQDPQVGGLGRRWVGDAAEDEGAGRRGSGESTTYDLGRMDL